MAAAQKKKLSTNLIRQGGSSTARSGTASQSNNGYSLRPSASGIKTSFVQKPNTFDNYQMN